MTVSLDLVYARPFDSVVVARKCVMWIAAVALMLDCVIVHVRKKASDSTESAAFARRRVCALSFLQLVSLLSYGYDEAGTHTVDLCLVRPVVAVSLHGSAVDVVGDGLVHVLPPIRRVERGRRLTLRVERRNASWR